MVNAGPRVLHVLRSRSPAGAEHHVLELTAALRGLGWASDVLIAAPRDSSLGEFPRALAAHCERVELVPMPADPSMRLARRIRHALREPRYAVVHTHMVHADWHAALVARRGAAALVSTKHNHDPFRRRLAIRLGERMALARADAVIAISASLAEFVEQTTGVRPCVVRYGVDPGPPPPPPPAGPPILAAIGRLERQKGFDLLLEAMPAIVSAVPGARLRIVGEGRLGRELRDRAEALGLGSVVEFLGWRDDVPGLLAETTALVHPARWEGFGMVLLEAMRAGRAVVAARVGAIPEVVEHGTTGLLVDPERPAAIADAVAGLLARPGTAAEMGAAARRRLESAFGAGRMAAETLSVYERALHGGAQPRVALTR